MGQGRIVIIGGGIAGLCAGVYGLRCGYDVEILEMHDRPGGLATSWRRGDYVFETCLHWLLGSGAGHPMHAHWREVFDIDRLHFVHPEEYVRLEDEDGRSLAIYTDLDRLEAELLAKAPEDAREIARFVGAARLFQSFEIPDPLQGLKDWLGLIPVLRLLRPLRRWAGMTLGQYGERFSNPMLRRFFQGGELSELSALAVVLTLAWMSRQDADYPIGGSQAVIRPIAETFEALGGRLRLGEKVEEILVKDGVAVGVRLFGGERVAADWVISAADGHATLHELLKGRWLDNRLGRAFAALKPFPSYVQVSLGVGRPLDEEPRFVTQILKAPIEVDPETRADQASFRIFNHDPSFAPAGKTAVTCQLPTRNWAYWTELRTEHPLGYQAHKHRLAEAVIDTLERRIPGVRAHVETVDVSTPATVIRYAGEWQGSMEGWMLTPTTGLRQLPMRLPGLERFLMAGQWVSPGGGLPGGLMSARAAIQALCRKDGRRFTATGPVQVPEPVEAT